MGLRIIGEAAKEGVCAGGIFEPAQEAAFEELRFQVIRGGAQTIFNQSVGFGQTMPTLVQDGQFELGVRDLAGEGQDPFEAADGFVRAIDHPVTLAGQVHEVGVADGDARQPIENGLGASQFKPRPQSAAGVDEGDQVLWILADGSFEEL